MFRVSGASPQGDSWASEQSDYFRVVVVLSVVNPLEMASRLLGRVAGVFIRHGL